MDQIENLSPDINHFANFGISPETLKSLEKMGFTKATPIQQQTIPLLLSGKTDFLGLASTGTGKTGAFGIPLIEKIDAGRRVVQALVLCPTRELALQVSEQIKKMGSTKQIQVATIYGGDSYRRQIQAIRGGAQVVVGTPGRLIDLLEQGELKLNEIETLVLDEADEMISMGFKEALETILKATENPDIDTSTWLFSATMNSEIRRVADRYLDAPKTVQVKASNSDEKPKIENMYITVQDKNKLETLERLIVMNPDFYGIIFCQTKMDVAEVAEKMRHRGLRVDSLHGDRTQKEREHILRQFRDRRITVIVATDVAARGLDIQDLTHVINFNLPRETESYVHRTGRTGRNGKTGIAISLVSPNQLNMLARISRVTKLDMKKMNIPSVEEMKKFQIQSRLTTISNIVLDEKVRAKWDEFLKNVPLFSELAATDSSEILIKWLISQRLEASHKEEVYLDYSPNRVPRELDSSGGGSRAPRSEGAGRGRNDSFTSFRRGRGGDRFERNDRGSDRSSDRASDRADRGFERSERGAERPADRVERSFSPRPTERTERSYERSERFGGDRERVRPARAPESASAAVSAKPARKPKESSRFDFDESDVFISSAALKGRSAASGPSRDRRGAGPVKKRR